MIIEPLVDAGVRLIHHCDGDVRPVVDDYIAIGFSGFQGFQYELGVDPYESEQRRSRLGEELLFFTGLSVSRTLPFGTPEDVRDEVDYFLDFTDGGQGAVPDHQQRHRRGSAAGQPAGGLPLRQGVGPGPRIPRWRAWPWRQTHSDDLSASRP